MCNKILKPFNVNMSNLIKVEYSTKVVWMRSEIFLIINAFWNDEVITWRRQLP